MTRIIAFYGTAEAGKSTAAAILRDYWGIPTFSFAEEIKTICSPIGHLLYGANLDKTKMRSLYQLVGGMGREVHEDFWVLRTVEKMEGFTLASIDDLRYLNEAAVVRAHGGVCVHIIRPGFENQLSPEQRKHSSEVELTKIYPDFTIVNTGNYADFRAKILSTLNPFLDDDITNRLVDRGHFEE